MALAVFLLGGAAALAGLTGGSWANFSALPIRGTRLVLVAVCAQALGSLIPRFGGPHWLYPAGLAVSAAAALAFCARNLRIAGVPLVTLGLLSNALVVLVNGSMPVSIDAASRANISISSIAAGDDRRHDIAGPGSTLRSLGDVIPLPLPWQPEVVSPGDALIAAGIGELVFLGMRGRRRRIEAAEPAPREPSAVALS